MSTLGEAVLEREDAAMERYVALLASDVIGSALDCAEPSAEVMNRWAERRPAAPARQNVYVVATTEGPRRIKIGTSVAPQRRILGLRTMSPVGLRLVGVWVVPTGSERTLHSRLAADRLHGEWFRAEALPTALKVLDEMQEERVS